MPTTVRAYRHLLRELHKSSISSPSARNPAITAHIRLALFSGPQTHRDIENAVGFLRANRLYKELLDRYNPLQDLTQEERVEATARRVGLKIPEEQNS